MMPPCRTGASPVCPQIQFNLQRGIKMGSSLLTNSSAMTALQTLRNISSQLSTTQNRISTGQRVSTASDNAAYWSIATSMRAGDVQPGVVVLSCWRHAHHRLHRSDDRQLFALYQHPERHSGYCEWRCVGRHDRHRRADRLGG